MLWEHFSQDAPRGEKWGEKCLISKSWWSLFINQMLNCSANYAAKKEMLLHLLRDRACRLVRYLGLKIVTFVNFKCVQIWIEVVHCFRTMFKIITCKYKFYPLMSSCYRTAFISCISDWDLSLLLLQDHSLPSICWTKYVLRLALLSLQQRLNLHPKGNSTTTNSTCIE